MYLRFLLLVSLGTMFLGACSGEEPNLYASLQRNGKAALVDCSPYSVQDELHSCLLLTNPLRGQMRVFDMTTKQYILGPTGYSPLIISLDKSTSNKGIVDQVVAVSESSFAYALDSLNSEVITVRTRPSATEATTFVTPKQRISLTGNVLAIAAARPAGSTNDFVLTAMEATTPGESTLQEYSVDPSTGALRKLGESPATRPTIKGVVQKLVVDETYARVAVVTDDKVEIFSLKATGLDASEGVEVPLAGVRQIGIQQIDLGLGLEWVLTATFVLGSDRKVKVLAQRGGQFISVGSVKLTSLPLELYFPPATAQPCSKEKVGPYVMVALANGTLETFLLSAIAKEDVQPDAARCVAVKDLKKEEKLGSKTLISDLSQIIGGRIRSIGEPAEGCARQTVFLFGTGLTSYSCEGKQDFVRF